MQRDGTNDCKGFLWSFLRKKICRNWIKIWVLCDVAAHHNIDIWKDFIFQLFFGDILNKATWNNTSTRKHVLCPPRLRLIGPVKALGVVNGKKHQWHAVRIPPVGSNLQVAQIWAKGSIRDVYTPPHYDILQITYIRHLKSVDWGKGGSYFECAGSST